MVYVVCGGDLVARYEARSARPLPALTIAFAVLANMTVLSGIVLWCARAVPAWRKRREAAATISETDASRRGDASRPRDPVDR